MADNGEATTLSGPISPSARRMVPLDIDEELPQADRDETSSRLSNAGVAIAVFKGNIGCAVLYMPRAWRNGGYVLSTTLLPFFGMMAVICSLRLVRCRLIGREGTFGDLTAAAAGRLGRSATEISVVMLQSGVCCAYFITVSQLLRATIFPDVAVNSLILGLWVIWAPMSLIRQVSKLSPFSFLGSMLVIWGLFATLWLEGTKALREHANLDHIRPVNWENSLIFLGTACFAFEGIGLVMPTFDASREPEKFPAIFSLTMLLIGVFIVSMGFLGYFAIGDRVSTVVLLDLPAGRVNNAIQISFALAIIFSFPLMIMPVFQVLEAKLFNLTEFPPPIRLNRSINIERFSFTLFLALVSIAGATDLDNFVSMIGAVCGLPLAFIFPSLCHLRLVLGPQASIAQKIPDLLFIVIGISLTVAISYVNVKTWGNDVG